MANDSIVANLFGLDPELLYQKQQENDTNYGFKMAQLAPEQAAAAPVYSMTQNLGRQVGSLLGIEDPAIAENSKILAVKKKAREMGLDPQSSDGLKAYAKLLAEAGMEDKAMQAGEKALQMAEHEAKTSKAQNDLLKEAQFRKALTTLDPSDPNYQEKLMQIASQFGSPDKVMDVHMKSMDKQERLAAKLEEVKAAAQAKVQAAIEAGKSREEVARIAADARKEAAGIMASVQKQVAQIGADSRVDVATILANQRLYSTDANNNTKLAVADKNNETKEKVADKNNQTKLDIAKLRGSGVNTSALEGKIASFDQALETLDRIEKHPGKGMGTGLTGPVATRIWGTDSYGFGRQIDAFKAQTFIPAVEALKGTGALSDAEGKKLTDAVGALDPGMSKTEFDAQIAVIRKDMSEARERVVQRLNTGGAASRPATTPVSMKAGAVPPPPSGFNLDK